MNKNNYYDLRIGSDGIVWARHLATNQWFPCRNDNPNDDLEDVWQLKSILPNFRHPYLKENYSL